MMVTIDDLDRMSMDDVLSYADKGLLDIEGADLIAEAYKEGQCYGEDIETQAYERGYEDGIVARDYDDE